MVMERTNHRVDNWTLLPCRNLCTSVSCARRRRRCGSGARSLAVSRGPPPTNPTRSRPVRTRAISTALSKARIALLYPDVGNVIGPRLRLRSVTL